MEIIRKTFGLAFEESLLLDIENSADLIQFKEGDTLINYGQYIKTMPLLISGVIKIMRQDFDSGELLLYFLEKGDTCAMTLSCCVGHKKSEIKAVAEKDSLIAMIPVAKMEQWMGEYKSWRNFVFESYHNRFNEMLTSIDQIAFMNMNDRIYNYLLDQQKLRQSNLINKTHQEIADELNSSRVVISRLLKSLEREGKITLNRNTIEIIVSE